MFACADVPQPTDIRSEIRRLSTHRAPFEDCLPADMAFYGCARMLAGTGYLSANV